MKLSQNEFTMELLAAMAGKIIAKKMNVSSIEGFDALMNSKTGEMLFDDNYLFWQNGPVYIANEFFLEKQSDRKSKSVFFS